MLLLQFFKIIFGTISHFTSRRHGLEHGSRILMSRGKFFISQLFAKVERTKLIRKVFQRVPSPQNHIHKMPSQVTLYCSVCEYVCNTKHTPGNKVSFYFPGSSERFVAAMFMTPILAFLPLLMGLMSTIPLSSKVILLH